MNFITCGIILNKGIKNMGFHCGESRDKGGSFSSQWHFRFSFLNFINGHENAPRLGSGPDFHSYCASCPSKKSGPDRSLFLIQEGWSVGRTSLHPSEENMLQTPFTSSGSLPQPRGPLGFQLYFYIIISLKAVCPGSESDEVTPSRLYTQ